MKFRLLDTGHRTAAENMAIDEVLLTGRAQNKSPNTIRFLQFMPACVLLGYHQVMDQEIRAEYCREIGVEINRRITGGGALFWDTSQLGWEIISGKDSPGFGGKVEGIYTKLCSATARALQNLGIKAAFRPRNDIEVNGRKISGTGGTETGGAFLFQGSLLVDFDVGTMLKVLKVPTEKLKRKEINSIKERVTCISSEIGQAPDISLVKQLIASELASELNISLTPEGLNDFEQSLLAEKLPYFKSMGWINLIQDDVLRTELQASCQTSGGLVRCSLILGIGNQYIEQAYFTGDFFSHPKRAIYDLEASFKGLSVDPGKIGAHINNFFAVSEIKLVGINPEDMIDLVNNALSKKG